VDTPRAAAGPAPREQPGAAAATDESLRDFLDRATAEKLRAALAAAGGSKSEAARRLGIDRTTLYRLLERLGVEG
jgi:transcriptional regulator of acetoin/glycerol metabolism